MDLTGRARNGMVYVDREGIASRETLAEWIGLAVSFAGSPGLERRAG